MPLSLANTPYGGIQVVMHNQRYIFYKEFRCTLNVAQSVNGIGRKLPKIIRMLGSSSEQ